MPKALQKAERASHRPAKTQTGACEMIRQKIVRDMRSI
jgi:hypothetical protein